MSRVLICALLATACRTTKPATHVEVVERDGKTMYVAGAAGPGKSKDQACHHAVSRSVKAIALRFSQDQDDIGDDVAKALGASDGQAILFEYARAAAMDGALQDVSFNPANHLCMATVSWAAPLFAKDAVLKHAMALKERELSAGDARSSAGSTSASTPKAPEDPCVTQKRRVVRAAEDLARAQADFDECMARTSGDENICHRYKLYVDQAKGAVARSGGVADTCKETFSEAR